MKTLFLPGASIKNKDWMTETIASLPNLEFIPIYWQHWQNTDDNSEINWNSEVEKITHLISEPVNILAKSVGSIIAAKLINDNMKVNKILLCGIPIYSMPESKIEIVECLKKIEPSKILVIQNELDPRGSFKEIEILIKSVDETISVLTQDRSDHSYSYPKLFKDFLS